MHVILPARPKNHIVLQHLEYPRQPFLSGPLFRSLSEGETRQLVDGRSDYFRKQVKRILDDSATFCKKFGIPYFNKDGNFTAPPSTLLRPRNNYLHQKDKLTGNKKSNASLIDDFIELAELGILFCRILGVLGRKAVTEYTNSRREAQSGDPLQEPATWEEIAKVEDEDYVKEFHSVLLWAKLPDQVAGQYRDDIKKMSAKR